MAYLHAQRQKPHGLLSADHREALELCRVRKSPRRASWKKLHKEILPLMLFVPERDAEERRSKIVRRSSPTKRAFGTEGVRLRQIGTYTRTASQECQRLRLLI